MATINGDFSIGNAYEYKPLQIPNMDKVFDGQRWAIERADKLKKEADAAAERKALKEAELAKDRNAEIAKEQTLLAQRLKFNTTGLTKEAEALVAKRAAELATLGGALGNVNDMTRPEVVQWNQDVDNLTNRIYEHQQYYNGLNKAATDYDAAVLGGVDVEEYNKQGNFEEYLGRIQKEGLDFTSPYMPKPIVKKPAEMTDAEWTKLQKDNHTYMESTTPGAFQGGAGNLSGKRQYTKQYTTKDNLFRTYAEGLVAKHNSGETTRDEEKAYRKLISEASIMGGLNDDGTLKPEYFAAIENKYRPEGGVETKIEEVNRLPQYITHPSGGENSNYSSNKDGSFTFGKGSTKATLVPKNELIRVGFDRQEGDAFGQKPLQEIGYPVVGAMDLNDATPNFYSGLIGDVAFEIVNGKAIPISTRDLGEGGFKMSQQALIPTTKDGKMMTNKEVEAAKKKGEPVSAELYVKTRLPSKFENKPDREILINTSRGMEQTLKQHKIPTTYDVTKQVYGDEKAEETPQTPVVQPKEKKTGTGYNRGSLPPSGK